MLNTRLLGKDRVLLTPILYGCPTCDFDHTLEKGDIQIMHGTVLMEGYAKVELSLSHGMFLPTTNDITIGVLLFLGIFSYLEVLVTV